MNKPMISLLRSVFCLLILFGLLISSLMPTMLIALAVIGIAAWLLPRLWTADRIQADWRIQDQFAGDIKRAMRLRVEKEFDQANAILNSLLKRDPEWPEALFLKAQVMWEGFGNVGSAKSYLEKIMRMQERNNKELLGMANSLYQELSEIEKT